MEGLKTSCKVARLEPSQTLALSSRAKEQKALDFTAGEPDFDLFPPVAEAAKLAIDQNFNKYTPAAGIKELREAIAAKFNRENGIDYRPDQVMASNGAKEVIYLALQTLLNPDDEVIVLRPYWLSYAPQITLSGGRARIIPASFENGKLSWDEELMRKTVNSKTKGIILNSPNNPCGYVFSRGFLESCAEFIIRNDMFVISDEPYEHYVYDGNEHISIARLDPEIYQRTITVNSISKTYGMPGWRIGYAGGLKSVITGMIRHQSHSTSPPNGIAQKAAVAALNEGYDFVKPIINEYDRRRRAMVEGLEQIRGIRCLPPQGAFYAYCDISELIGRTYKNKAGKEVRINGSSDMADYLLEKVNVGVMPGVIFEGEGYLRVSFATNLKNIEEGIRRIKEAAADL